MSSVKVAVRVRPFNNRENIRQCKCVIGMHGTTTSKSHFLFLFPKIIREGKRTVKISLKTVNLIYVLMLMVVVCCEQSTWLYMKLIPSTKTYRWVFLIIALFLCVERFFSSFTTYNYIIFFCVQA